MKIIFALGLIIIFVSLIVNKMFFFKTRPLQERARSFLEMQIPEDLAYYGDSFAERFIVEYANTGKLRLDAEMSEMLQMVVMESQKFEDADPGTSKAFMNESSEILQEILNEVSR